MHVSTDSDDSADHEKKGHHDPLLQVQFIKLESMMCDSVYERSSEVDTGACISYSANCGSGGA